MPNEEQQKKIQKIALDVLNLSRNCLVINLRFMDSAISRLTLTEGVTERTATDGENYYYDPVHILRSYKKARELPIRRFTPVYAITALPFRTILRSGAAVSLSALSAPKRTSQASC